MLLLWISPILLFVLLSAMRRVPALAAAALALMLSVLVVLFAGPVTVNLNDVSAMFLAGVWIALPAVLVILAGLYFTEVLVTPDTAGIKPTSARALGTTCLFVGPFVETATGFGVGYVVAVTGILRAGIAPMGALALGAFSQCLVPWGALGVGTRISAAIAGVTLDDLMWRIALICVPILLVMVWLFWRIASAAGVKISSANKREDVLSVAALGGLLIVTNRFLPIELAGLLAIGPVLLFRLWREDGAAVFSGAGLRRGIPYLLLLGLLALSKLVPPIEAMLSAQAFTVGQGAPLFAPLASPAWPLLLAALLGCFAHGNWAGLSSALPRTAAKGMRASVMTILLVALAWITVRAGIAEAFAQALRGWIGAQAGLFVPILGGVGGYLTGSNTGAGSLAMPVATTVVAQGSPLFWVASAAIVAGSVFTAFSPIRFAMGRAIAGASEADAGAALRALLPLALGTLLIAVLAVVFFG